MLVDFVPRSGPARLAALFASASLLAACSSAGGLGASCDPSAADSCDVGLVCDPDPSGDSVCRYAPGSLCNLETDDVQCAGGALCSTSTELNEEGVEVVVGRCFVQEGGVCDPAEPYCAEDLTCAELVDGTYQCHAPLLFVGRVIESTAGAAIAGAHVLGVDDESVAVTDVALSAATGAYELEVPIVRDAEGAPLEENFTLRGSADGYQTFPGGIRTALPINSTSAVRDARGWVVEGTITDIVLLAVEDPAAPRVTVSGTVVADRAGGVLVVAEAADGSAHTAISDARGAYTIFNVPPGSYEVRGYAADVQLVPVGIEASANLTGVDLVESTAPLTTLHGSINIVNSPGGSVTSVVLVVESTFSDTFGRGEVPPGLRAPRSGPVSISGEWTIEGVPDGSYVVLAAFENDLLVRDPDENIAGTDFVVVDLPGASQDVTLADAFKVTEALPVVGPGAMRPTPVTAPPTLEWGDDSSESFYSVVVYNAYGELVFEVPDVPSVSGSDTVTVEYGGPMEMGMYYQFRATSWRQSGGQPPSPISTTEDLLGVFYVTE